MTGLLYAGSLAVALGLSYRPFGDYLARVYTSGRHLRGERLAYRALGVDPDADQTWSAYLRAVLAFSLVSVLALYAFLRLQAHLPLSLGRGGMEPGQAFNTAASFVTNTDWQSYAGESALGHLVQMAGLAVQNFVSAAVGIAVAIAMVRGFARSRTDRIGNFWVDLVRTIVRVLLPISLVAAVVLVAGGVVQDLHASGGPVASQEAIKELGTNGGGFFNANSAHPFENPAAWTGWLQTYLMLVIAFSLPRTFGRMVGDIRQGLAIVAVMTVLAVGSVLAVNAAEAAHHGTVPVAVGAAMEGKEVRFGVPASATYAAATTLTSTGAVNSAHDSYTSLGGGVLLGSMMLGEVAPGGAGSGLYGMLVLATLAVFVGGLMVGRTPEYLGKKIAGREVKLASLYILTTPLLVLVGTGLAVALPGQRAGLLNTGPHGLSEALYAFTSAGSNNGSAFAGIAVNTAWYNTALGVTMLLARLLPIVFVLALAGSLARQRPVPASEGTLPTHRPLFVGLVTGVTLIVGALTFFPALALGPLAEGLHL
jgi:K+-transporting ATPase ATPase A chain